mmetsp:Transcript_16763/g.31736  ORF Transcript_16763/g.31736 Transcript_16763/m.31736 type:complete len:219 (-) Transcript_16763:130-786(-)
MLPRRDERNILVGKELRADLDSETTRTFCSEYSEGVVQVQHLECSASSQRHSERATETLDLRPSDLGFESHGTHIILAAFLFLLVTWVGGLEAPSGKDVGAVAQTHCVHKTPVFHLEELVSRTPIALARTRRKPEKPPEQQALLPDHPPQPIEVLFCHRGRHRRQRVHQLPDALLRRSVSLLSLHLHLVVVSVAISGGGDEHVFKVRRPHGHGVGCWG